MNADELRPIRLPEVAADGISQHLAKIAHRLRFSDDGRPYCLRQEAAVGRVLHHEDNLAQMLLPEADTSYNLACSTGSAPARERKRRKARTTSVPTPILQHTLDLRRDGRPCLAPLQTSHQELIICRVLVPNVRPDGQAVASASSSLAAADRPTRPEYLRHAAFAVPSSDPRNSASVSVWGRSHFVVSFVTTKLVTKLNAAGDR